MYRYIALALLPLLGLALLAVGVSSGLMVTLLSLMYNMGFHTWRINRVQAEFGRVNYAIRTLRAFRALIPPEAFRTYDCCCSLTCLHVYASMALEDPLDQDESYSIVEIKSLKRILDAVEWCENVLCAVDEVLRGTNTVERITASSELLRVLSQSGAICLAAAHGIELCRLLGDCFTLAHFEERVEDGAVRFDDLLKSGPAVTRNAIRLLELLGYPKALTSTASARAERFERTGIWA